MIFDEQVSRKPDYYPWTKRFIDAMWTGFWTPNEFDFQNDLHQFKVELAPMEQQIIIRALSAISQIEVGVKKFWARLGDTLPHPSIVDLGLVMAHVEVIHNRAYEKLLDVLNLNEIFQQNMEEEVISGRVKYLRKYLDKVYTGDNRKQFVYSLILFTLFVENVSLFSQFYIITWFNRYRNMLKDTAQQVQYTAKEEQLHSMAGIQIINVIRKEYPEFFDEELRERIEIEARSAYEAECKIIDWMLGDYEDIKLSSEVLKNYVAHRINQSLNQIGFGSSLEVDQAMVLQTTWMDEEVLAPAATDFFHKRPVEYSKKMRVISEDSLF